jgi:hypothetical protein
MLQFYLEQDQSLLEFYRKSDRAIRKRGRKGEWERG